jgi:glycosyltransferase involved in cell wall biosynthesis
MALSLTEDQIAIGTVGMLEPRKGHRFLIGALARMRQSNRGLGWRCFIAGGGSLQADLMNQIAALETSNQLPHGAIRLLGTSPDPYPLLSALDLFVMPSLAEGLGVAALEAMAAGLPVVASAAGGLRDLVIDGMTGLLVPPGDTAALAITIGSLAASPPRRFAMGAEGRERVVKHFSLEAMALKTLALYRECLARQL